MPKKLYKVESLVLDCFEKTIKTRFQKEKTKLFSNLNAELTLLAENPSEKQSFDYFDYISWTESKIQNRSFAEIVKMKPKNII